MTSTDHRTGPVKGITLFEKYLTVWVLGCIVAAVLLGKLAPGLAASLDEMAIHVGNVPDVEKIKTFLA